MQDEVRDFEFPDRLVVGTDDERARKVLGEVYRPLSLNQAPIMYSAQRTAEVIKYAANAFLTLKITFINEIADLAEKASADVQDGARGIGMDDNRIGSKFLHAGPGFGGSCFPKDIPALLQIPRRELPDIEYCDDPYTGVRDADAVVIVTEWVQYRTLDPIRLKREMAHPVVVDLRNVYPAEKMAEHGFRYEGVGRGSPKPRSPDSGS